MRFLFLCFALLQLSLAFSKGINNNNLTLNKLKEIEKNFNQAKSYWRKGDIVSSQKLLFQCINFIPKDIDYKVFHMKAKRLVPNGEFSEKEVVTISYKLKHYTPISLLKEIREQYPLEILCVYSLYCKANRKILLINSGKSWGKFFLNTKPDKIYFLREGERVFINISGNTYGKITIREKFDSQFRIEIKNYGQNF